MSALHTGSALEPAPTLLDSVLQSVLTPPGAPGLVAAINVSLVALLATLGGMAVVGMADVHSLVMGALAVGLLASVNYFIGVVRPWRRRRQRWRRRRRRTLRS